MKLLDLFCGEGGASVGYSRAGLDVIGVDNCARALRRYPFESFCGDWLTGLEMHGADCDVIHASPPCQRYSTATTGRKADQPDLVDAVREALEATGKPYVIENVPLAPLRNPVILCGGMFGLEVITHGERFMLIRHRAFEPGRWAFAVPAHKAHSIRALTVIKGQTEQHAKYYAWHVSADDKRAIMQAPWMTGEGCAEAIPPAYAEYIGSQFIAANMRLAA